MIELRSDVIIWTQVNRINNLKALSGPQALSSQNLLHHVYYNELAAPSRRFCEPFFEPLESAQGVVTGVRGLDEQVSLVRIDD
jgi:hypothetical protein